MLDYELLALQCSLLSAEASGLTSVQNYQNHGFNATPSSAGVQQPAAPQTVTEASGRRQAGSLSRADYQVTPDKSHCITHTHTHPCESLVWKSLAGIPDLTK